MSSFTVRHDGRDGEQPFSNYLYAILKDDRLVAQVSHTYRGDEHFIRLVGGEWRELPERIVDGGGPEPLRLTKSGNRLIETLAGG